MQLFPRAWSILVGGWRRLAALRPPSRSPSFPKLRRRTQGTSTMGGGNGQKSAAKRERNNAKKMKEAKNKNHAESKAKMEADRTGLKCKICMTTFLITASKTQLNDHYESKHAAKGFTIEQCFPGKV